MTPNEMLSMIAQLRRERDEAREEWGKASMDAAKLLSEKTKVMAERDEAREWQNVKVTKNGETHCLRTLIELLERERDEAMEKYFVMRDLSNNATELSEKYKRERDEAREAFIEARKHREQLNSLLQSYEACWDEIKTTLGEPEEGDQTCDLDRVLKAIRERDEARAVAKLAYSILAKVNRRSLEDAAARSSIKHINNTPMEWLYSIIQNWEATQ